MMSSCDIDEIDAEEDANPSFPFRYFSEVKLNEIVKKVQQDKRKEHEELEWRKHVSKKQELEKEIQNTERVSSDSESVNSESSESSEDEFVGCEQPTKSTLVSECYSLDSGQVPAGLQPIAEESFIKGIYITEEGPNAAELKDLNADCREPLILPSSVSVRAVASKTALNETEGEHTQNLTATSVQRNSRPDPCCDLSVNSKVSLSSRGEGPARGNVRNSENVRRIQSFWRKMSESLDKIAFLFDKTPNPDDMADYNRRCKRAADFSSLFGRNYIYPLGRKIAELHDREAPIGCAGPTLPACVYKHLVDAHQISATALVSYLSHMPTSVVAGVPDKLQKLLQSVLDLCQLCAKFRITAAEADANGDGRDAACNLVAKKCRGLLQVLDKKKAALTAVVAKPKQLGPQRLSGKPKDVVNPRKRVQNKTSPYLVTMLTKGTMARSVKNLARKRFGPPPPAPPSKTRPKQVLRVPVVEYSDEHTGTSNSTSSVGTEEEEEEEEEEKVEKAEIGSLVRRMRHTQRGIKHNVSYAASTKSSKTTMVGKPSGDAVQKSSCELVGLPDSASLVETRLYCQEELFRRLLPVLSGMKLALNRQRFNEHIDSTSLEELRHLLQQVELPDDQQPSTVASKSSKNEQNQQAKVVRVGSTNAQLIVLPAYEGPEQTASSHILDETNASHRLDEASTRQCIISDIGSLAGPLEAGMEQNQQGCVCLSAEQFTKPIKGNSDNAIKAQAEDSTASNKQSEEKESAGTGGDSCLTDTAVEKGPDCSVKDKTQPCQFDLTTALEIPDQVVLAVLEYVNSYREFIKDIPIYKESVKPWKVIGRLSNQLVDDALKQVVKELEVEPLMSMMYQLEFQ